jgi:hypothetical protein
VRVTQQGSFTPVPEPGALALLAMGGLGVLVWCKGRYSENNMPIFTRHAVATLALAAIFAVLGSNAAIGGDRYWVGTSGWWYDTANWSSGGPPGAAPPGAGDNVYLTQLGSTDRDVSYSTSPSWTSTFALLRLDALGSGMMTLRQALNHPLYADIEQIGLGGHGTYEHTSGLNDAEELYLGYYASGNGLYILNSAGRVQAYAEYVGYHGTGTFRQIEGDNVATRLYVGHTAGSVGVYEMLGGSFGPTGWDAYIGYEGQGSLVQSGGTFTVDPNLRLFVAYESSSSGTVALSGGTLNGGDNEFVGRAGTGTFLHTGGTNSVARAIILGSSSGSQGRYELSGSGLLLGQELRVGSSGDGQMVQTGGTVTLEMTTTTSSGTVTIGGTTWIGTDAGSTGTYQLSGGAHSADAMYIGNYGSGSVIQTGGANDASLQMGVLHGSQGLYKLSGGTLTSYALMLATYGTARFQHNGPTYTLGSHLYAGWESGGLGQYELSAGTLDVTGNAYLGIRGRSEFTQAGGAAKFGGSIIVGNDVSGECTWIHTGGTVQAGSVLLGQRGTGEIVQSGGSWNAGFSLVLGDTASGTGTWQLSGTGALSTVDEVIGASGAGRFTQSGGSHLVANRLTVAANTGSTGQFELSGGVLSAGDLTVNSGGTLDFSGGTLLVTRLLANSGEVRISGSGPRSLGPMITNFALWRADGTTADYSGLFTNFGSYFSAGATNRFDHLSVPDPGFIQAAANDTFRIAGDMTVNSTQSSLWDTADATLTLAELSGHTVSVPGTELGADYAGYTANFAWGRLELETGASLTLQDGNATAGGAMYVSVVSLADGLSQIASISGNGLNIYYDPSLADNAYLAGASYALASGGQLIPVPEPSALAMLGTCAAGLLAWAWRGKRPPPLERPQDVQDTMLDTHTNASPSPPTCTLQTGV